ncbi:MULTISPECIES: hypothetical protein [unclassified Crossiella]|uniref:hypothetical protein n=1 Tax=unclassified Crossiella TaxID=2620835 RepID=UPI001FFFFF12|nr:MULTISPECIES: hypothetical protein [unclassified Crossiella]MCK2240624.1 hypothetical protein [Crossiella sp. S99.2]MCK2252925.1 hypothetical protein [Crossiella sp. S99.1]
MSSFPERSRQAEDAALPVRQRLLALQDCVKAFPVYGHHATWRHLITWARIPRRLEDDLDSLGRAVAELRAARGVWLPVVAEFAARRQAEKALGRRTLTRRDQWMTRRLEVYCPDPDLRPVESMARVVARVIDGYRDGSVWGRDCVVCGAGRAVEVACPGCGVFIPGSARWKWR